MQSDQVTTQLAVSGITLKQCSRELIYARRRWTHTFPENWSADTFNKWTNLYQIHHTSDLQCSKKPQSSLTNDNPVQFVRIQEVVFFYEKIDYKTISRAYKRPTLIISSSFFWQCFAHRSFSFPFFYLWFLPNADLELSSTQLTADVSLSSAPQLTSRVLKPSVLLSTATWSLSTTLSTTLSCPARHRNTSMVRRGSELRRLLQTWRTRWTGTGPTDPASITRTTESENQVLRDPLPACSCRPELPSGSLPTAPPNFPSSAPTLPVSHQLAQLFRVSNKSFVSVQQNFSVPSHCPSGYTWYDETDFCYKSTVRFTNFNDARSACQAEGGDLASIHSQAENQFLVGEVLSTF